MAGRQQQAAIIAPRRLDPRLPHATLTEHQLWNHAVALRPSASAGRGGPGLSGASCIASWDCCLHVLVCLQSAISQLEESTGVNSARERPHGYTVAHRIIGEPLNFGHQLGKFESNHVLHQLAH
jgi:hypothetical protein